MCRKGLCMPGPWDDVVKELLRKSPQEFAEWLVAEGSFVAALSVELKRRDTQIYADGLFKIRWYEQDMLLHLEFQKRKDPTMAERLLEYSVQASRAYNNLPVYSCVVYLVKDSEVPQPPFRRVLPNGREIIRFDYESIELWKIPAEVILQTGLIGLFPLITLTEDGKTAEALDAMVEALAINEERDLLVLAYTLASLVFTSEADIKMLKRRFAMLGDILRDTWAYQEIMEEGREEGFQKGREEGLQKGLKEGLQALHHVFVSITQTSFPELKSLARRKAALITEPKVLEDVTLKMLAARSSEEARQILNDIATVE
jgi:predicted transposase YdaD